jgi:hypothetical protein
MNKLFAKSKALLLVALVAIIALCGASPAYAASSLSGLGSVARVQAERSQSDSASSVPCNLTHLTGTCQSTDHAVTVSTYAYGNVSKCTFIWSFSWGDGRSSHVTMAHPADGWTIVGRHTYGAVGTYRMRASGRAVGAKCTLTAFTATFRLVSPPPPKLVGSHVRVWGLAACTDQNRPLPLPGPRYEVSRLRFQAANGEVHDAKISGFNYHVDFSHVPVGGETVFVYVTCKLDSSPSWGTSFRLTRHVLQLQYLDLIRL